MLLVKENSLRNKRFRRFFPPVRGIFRFAAAQKLGRALRSKSPTETLASQAVRKTFKLINLTSLVPTPSQVLEA